MSTSTSNTLLRANGSPASSPSLSNPPSKLPRFLQKQATRDRSKSESVTVSPSTASGSTPLPTEPNGQKQRRSSKFLTINKERKSSAPADDSTDFAMDEPPIIVEPPPASPPQQQHQNLASPGPVPIPSPRARTRSERPVASAPETQHMQTLYASTSSTGGTRIGDLPTRLSGWFAHTFSTSSTDLSLPAILAQHSGPRGSSPSGYESSHSTASPRKMTGPAALLAAAKHGKGTLDKAMRYLLDSDAVPDRCADAIWLLGVSHPGWEGPAADAHAPPAAAQQQRQRKESRIKPRRGSWRSSSSSAASSSADGHSSPTTSSTGHSGSATGAVVSAGKGRAPVDPGAAWPPAFYADFTSRVWLTYRSHLPSPIRDARLAELEPCSPMFGPAVAGGAGAGADEGYGQDHGHGMGHDSRSPTAGRKVWPWAAEKTWSADTGWGCMLRTGQSLLANALVGVVLGRDWRRPPHPVATADYAAYVRILTWFLDTPAPQAPFSVHRMALAGKELGTDVGQWFGPSVAAGAIKTLVNSFPECGLSVALATDSTLYQSQVFAASHGDASRAPRRQHTATWGERPVLLLLGIRLGIEGVNPIYYETIKMLYTFPQSVGIAGGRPSSSYYFVGSQADSLFYLDPHNPRPAIPLRPAPPRAQQERYMQQRRREEEEEREMRRRGVSGLKGSQRRDDDDERRSSPERDTGESGSKARRRAAGASTHQHHTRIPTSPSSVKTGSSNFSYHAPTSPSPLQQQFSSSSTDSRDSRVSTSADSADAYADAESAAGWDGPREDEGRSPPPSYQQHAQHRFAGASQGRFASPSPSPASASPRRWDRPERADGGGRTPSEIEHAELTMDVSELGTEPVPAGAALLDPVQLHYCNAYSSAELKTFHCERVRKMPLSGLDPSMLIGFVCRDEKDWWDFRRRVAELPKTIFSIQEEPPTWPSDLDDNMGLESISEPDDMDLDEEGVEVDGGDGEEQFFDTHSGSASSKSGHGHDDGRGHRSHRRSTDTSEEDPTDPVTPGPTSRFEIRAPVAKRKGKEVQGAEDDDEDEDEQKGLAFGEEADFGEEDGEEADGDDIEDDWIDPSVPTPTDMSHTQRPPSPAAKGDSPPPPPPPAKDKHSSSSSSTSKHSSSTGKTKKAKKQVPVPVPAVRVPPQQEHYPFPVTPAEEPLGGTSGERPRSTSGRKTQRMHNARARDGGRTQSGGVKGILTDD